MGHESTGEGAARHIVISKKSSVTGSAKAKNSHNECTNLRSAVDITDQTENEKSEEKPLVDHKKCSNCQRNVPILNFEIHKARCPAKLIKEKEMEIKDVKPRK